MHNRFIEMDRHLKSITGKQCRTGAKGARVAARAGHAPRRTSASMSAYAQPFSAADRALVILIENGGEDLGIPTLVDKILSAVPGLGGLISDSYKAELVKHIRDKIKGVTDWLIETAELAINRYSAAAPDLFGEVAILRDGTSSYDDLKGKLISLSQAQKIIDLFILTHGREDHISVRGDINSAKIRSMKDALGRPLSIRCVYMMNCKGASLNQAWLDAGAKASSASIKNNYLPEPTMYFFWQNWKAGQTFENAATSAYNRTINLMNETVRGFIRGIPIPGTGALADLVDFKKFDFVTDSAPMIQGQGTVTINTDKLTFAKSMSSSLATTILPAHVLASLGRSGGTGSSLARSYSFHNPSTVMQLTRYSIQQSPVLIAGLEVADAASIGLAAVGVAQAQASASQGSFTLTFDKAARLLTNEARSSMPGAQSTKKSYSHRLFWLAIGAAIDTARADVIIEWEGNPYGEIGTPNIRRNLPTSTDWSRSAANIAIIRVDRIPLPDTDPRTWPVVYTYEGTYDPLGNGYFEFSGEFEVNAFGGLKFNRQEVVSRSFADWAIGGTPEAKVRKGDDVIVAVPAIPQEQINYLKKMLP